ncbi:MAG: amidohydrolase [Spirochaetales bacterium]|nr:amidohydrolase [Spirochaetales bacterium]
MKDKAELQQMIEKVKEDVIAWRRHFHANPELSFKEYETSKFIYEQLESFGGFELSRPTETSVMARLIGKEGGKTIALRADIDALAMPEENDVEYASKNPGVMHSCGHDCHAAVLLGVAKVFSTMKNEINGEIRFFFQHAEEVPPGGASQMVAAGVMEGVDNILGLHVGPAAPCGMMSLTPGPITADGMNCKLKIIGKGGHSSSPEQTIDPVSIGAEVVLNLQHIVSRYTGAMEKVVFSTTKFKTPGEAYNVIPSYVELGMNARGVSTDFREKIPAYVERIVKGITEAHGATYEIEFEFTYPAVVNDPDTVEIITKTMKDVYGEEKIFSMPPMMGGEDFSAFSSIAPGCFMMLGVGNPEKGACYMNHHPKFDVDEDGLTVGVGFFVYGALSLLDK